jgi:FtsK/SpoIIIE family
MVSTYSKSNPYHQFGAMLAATFQFPIGPDRDNALQALMYHAPQMGIAPEYVQQQIGYHLAKETPDYSIQQDSESENDGAMMLDRVVEIMGRFSVPLIAVEAVEGPRVWGLRFRPDDVAGMVRVSKIEQHLDDLAARIPGFVNPIIEYKTPIEIQVQKATWYSCHLIDYVKMEERSADAPFNLSLGVGLDGDVRRIEVEHIQIAGCPGSGKTALQNALIGDMMLRYPPWLCQWVFIDIEKVGLKSFNGMPWFWRGVDRSLPDRAIVDPALGYDALSQLLIEHERRLDQFDTANVDDIYRYNRRYPNDPLPHLVCLIDETWAFRHNAGRALFADEIESIDALIKAGENAIDQKLIEIAQRCRKTGIHLIVATQRASQDVLNPMLRASLSTKVALKASDEGSSAVAFGYKCDWAIRLGKKGDFWLVHEDGVHRCQALYIDRDEPVGHNGETRLDELIQGGHWKYQKWREDEDARWRNRPIEPVPRQRPVVINGGRSEREDDERQLYDRYCKLVQTGKSEREVLIELFGHRHNSPETAAAGNSRKSYLKKIEDWKSKYESTNQNWA